MEIEFAFSKYSEQRTGWEGVKGSEMLQERRTGRGLGVLGVIGAFPGSLSDFPGNSGSFSSFLR